MRNTHILALFFVMTIWMVKPLQAQLTTDPKMSAYIDGLMARMTTAEKIGQLNLPVAGEIKTGEATSSDIQQKIKLGEVGGLFNVKSAARIREIQKIAVEQSRLKIPLLFGMDVIHGYKTLFPIPIGLSCTWDMNLVQESAAIAAREASADGICWTFAPMVDISRDPRWGRVSEGSGEDPYLGSLIGAAMVKGFQGKDYQNAESIMACVKHFALYGASEAGRDYNTTDMSKVRMYNEYLPPYKAAIEAGAGSVMTSFNEIHGIPATANRWLLDELLRNAWGFKGLVVTDYTAISEMTAHGLGELQEVSAKALHAGVDLDMVSEGFTGTLPLSLKEGKVTIQEVNKACRRILEAKYRLGLFADPYRYCKEGRAATDIFTAANRASARKVAANSLVLLKNEGQILPLKKQGTIALIGPLASNRENMAGTWSVAGDFGNCVSLEDGLRAAAGDKVKILKAWGTNVVNDSLLDARISIFGKPTYRQNRSQADMVSEAVKIAAKADVIVAALGESAEMSGESASRSDISLPENQQELLKALLETGKPVVLVLFNGRPLSIPWESAHVPVILEAWFPGTEAGNAIADVLFGDHNPCGKLSASFPQNTGQIPIYYNHKNTGRPMPEGASFLKFKSGYLDIPNEPVYPFGYGLSYSHFVYGDLQLSRVKAKGNITVTATVELKNEGKYAGEEVVQLYIRDLVGSITRPVMELKGFQKLMLKPGESKIVTFPITPEQLKFYNSILRYDWESGAFEIMVGGNSRDVKRARLVWEK